MSLKANRCPSCGSNHVKNNKCESCGAELAISINDFVNKIKISATTEQIAFLVESAANSYECGQLGSAIRSLQDARKATSDASELEGINAFIQKVGMQLRGM